MAKADPTVRTLQILQRKARHPPQDGFDRAHMLRRVPSQLAGNRRRNVMMALDASQCEAFRDALAMLTNDLRFEWLGEKKIDEALWHFTCEARFDPERRDLVGGFVGAYAKEATTQTCFFPVIGLSTDTAIDLFGIRLLPPAEAPPPESLAPWADLLETSGSVATTEVRGTRASRIAARGQEVVEHALRVLRMTLRAHREIADYQLRFRLGRIWWLDDGSHRWRLAHGEPAHLGLRSDLLDMAAAQPVAALPASTGSKIDEHARIALGWFEKAQLEDDPVPRMLYLFFALEAILGDESEGLKGEKLALRRAILGHLTTGSFIHPAQAYVLYDEVRSKAVHGGVPVPMTDSELVQFAADVRDGINEFIQLAQSRQLTRRGDLRKVLDEDDARDELAARLYAEDPKLWAGVKPTTRAAAKHGERE